MRSMFVVLEADVRQNVVDPTRNLRNVSDDLLDSGFHEDEVEIPWDDCCIVHDRNRKPESGLIPRPKGQRMAPFDAPDPENDCFEPPVEKSPILSRQDELDQVVLKRLAMDPAVDGELDVRFVLSVSVSKLVLALLRLLANLVVTPLS